MNTPRSKGWLVFAPLVVGLTLGAFLLGFRMGKGSEKESPRAVESTVASQPSAAPSFAAPVAVPRKPVALLSLLDLTKSTGGEWTRVDDALVATAQKDQAINLALPGGVPEEYDLQMVIERVSGAESVHIGLISGSKQFMVVLDGLDKEGHKSGIECIAGEGFRTNETTVIQRLFGNNQPRKVRCSVRRDGVQVHVDDAPVIRWRGPLDRLSMGTFFKAPDRKSLFLGCWGSVFHFRDIVLTPLPTTE